MCLVVFAYLCETPVLAASHQSSDDLGHTALCGFVGVTGQPLHVGFEYRQESVAIVSEKTLFKQEQR